MELGYLGLRNNYIQELPLCLGNLKRLQVLDIAQNFMVEVPDVIWGMEALEHLYLSDVVCQKPLKIDAANLHTLTYITVDNWVYELSAMETMKGLHKPGIEEVDGNPDLRKLFASLAELRILKNLILRGSRFRSMPCLLDELGILRGLTHLKLDGKIAELPSSSNFPPNLHFLTMVNSSLDQDPMLILEKLPKLIYLKLRNAFTGRRMMISCQGFPMLQALCMEELWNLRNVGVEEGGMAKLDELEINSCPYLETLPEAMVGLKKIKMATTKNIEKKIRGSGLIKKVEEVEINP